MRQICGINIKYIILVLTSFMDFLGMRNELNLVERERWYIPKLVEQTSPTALKLCTDGYRVAQAYKSTTHQELVRCTPTSLRKAFEITGTQREELNVSIKGRQRLFLFRK